MRSCCGLAIGQELNEESYAICLADMLVKHQDATNIRFGNSLSDDAHAGEHFDYCIANPPFGVDWTKVESEVRTGNDFDDFLRGKEPFVIDGALDAGKASADFFKGVLDDEDFRQRTTYLAMRVLYDRYRAGAA